MKNLPTSMMPVELNENKAHLRHNLTGIPVTFNPISLIGDNVTSEEWNNFKKKHGLNTSDISHIIHSITGVFIKPQSFNKEIERSGRLTKLQSALISLLDLFLHVRSQKIQRN